MDLRKEFVLKSLEKSEKYTDLCREYGVSTKTGYKWKMRFLEEGFAGLNDQSRRPAGSPARVSEDVILKIIRIRIQKKHWGAKKIREVYGNKNPGNLPSLSTVERILSKAGLIEKRKRNTRVKGISIVSRVEAKKLNEVWTIEFKE